jgi:hypothetical protein
MGEVMNKTLNRILKVADKAYPDGLIGQAVKGQVVCDGLAKFIVNEIKAVCEGEPEATHKEISLKALLTAKSELSAVITAIENLKEN